MRIDYDKLFTYQSGRSRFVGAHISVMGRAGRDFDIRAKEAEIAENKSQIDLRGAVVITTSDGLKVETETATYTESDGVTRAPGPVRFSRARMTGSSVGASYDRQRDVLWMLDQAHITVAPDDKGAGGADVTAGAAGYAKRDRYIRFERSVKMRRGPQLITADGAVVTLEAAADVVDQIELRGSAQVAGVGQGANGLESMRSRDMNLGMADDGQTLQQATLVGEAVVRVAGGANAPAQQLASQAVDVEIAADGQSVQGLSAQDDVQLDLPAANPGAPTRRIRSRSLDADGEPGVPGLRTARFAGDVEFREAAPAAKDKPAVERIVRAPALETKLQSGLGTIDRATFTEGVSVKDGTRTAQGPTMIYDVAQGTIALSSPAGATGFVQVSDERVNIEAGSLEWTLDGTRMVAQTNVKSVLKPGAGPAGSKAVKRPSMLTADQPINVTAATMTYNQQTGHAEYTGDAQLWQGATSIRAKTITLDEATGNLTAKDAVRSVMRIETKNTAKPEATTADTAGPAPVAATATATAPATTPAAGAAAPPRAAGPGAAPPRPRRHGRVTRAGQRRRQEQAIGAGERHDRHGQRAGLRRRRAARPLHRHRPHGRRAGRPARRADRALLRRVGPRGVAARRLRQRALQPQGAPGREPALGQRRPPHLLRRRGALRAERPARDRGRAARRAAVPRNPGPHAHLLQLERQRGRRQRQQQPDADPDRHELPGTAPYNQPPTCLSCARTRSRSPTAAARWCAASASRSAPAKWSACSARTAPARPRRSTWSSA